MLKNFYLHKFRLDAETATNLPGACWDLLTYSERERLDGMTFEELFVCIISKGNPQVSVILCEYYIGIFHDVNFVQRIDPWQQFPPTGGRRLTGEIPGNMIDCNTSEAHSPAVPNVCGPVSHSNAQSGIYTGGKKSKWIS